MNIIQRAKAQAAAEAGATQGGRVRHASAAASAKKRPELVEGELQWIGEYIDPRETRPCKLSGGDKEIMTPQEQRLFARTPFERGFMEYSYEGTLRVAQGAADPKDPRHSHREGTGTMKYPGGELFEGAWRGNRRHGEGYLTTPKGYRFQGTFVEDVPTGPGHELFSSRSAYDCSFEYGQPQGQGVLLYVPSTGYRYEGEFRDGLRHGKGTIYYDSGDVFSGTFEQGKRHGRGITTTRSHGREMQYATEWERDVMVGGPSAVEKNKRTRKPKPTIKYSAQGTPPADLTKWKVKDEVTELPMEHFIRIKLGFEKLDRNGSGSLSTEELSSIWGKGSQEMLRKLDQDQNGTVELDEIFAGWYPNVPQHNINRFLQLDISPKQLLRLRGYLAGVEEDVYRGYLHITGVKDVAIADEVDPPLSLRQLDAAQYKIGGEKFSLAMYEVATVLCDPPHFLEVLEAWYPNIPRTTLNRYELTSIPPEELAEVRSAFLTLSDGRPELSIQDLEECQQRFRAGTVMDDPGASTIDRHCTEGFFKGQPFWLLGTIRVSVRLLEEIDRSDRKIVGGVSLPQLLRYCYPNIPCKRTQEHLTGRRRVGVAPCSCQICGL